MAAIRSFEGASLFIDDCSDGNIVCVNAHTGGRSTLEDYSGYCWSWSDWCCFPCEGIDYGSLQCYQRLVYFCAQSDCYATFDWQVIDCPVPTNPFATSAVLGTARH